MATAETISARRRRLLNFLFPSGVPVLWCPSLTHYDEQGAIDTRRTAAHLRHLSAHVRGLLVPGSTGDAWELSAEETRQVMAVALEHARELGLFVLLGALKRTASDALQTIRETMEGLKLRSGEQDELRALSMTRVCGFTVCAPSGLGLAQEDIRAGLESILDTGLPTAVYQLPQVTQNEISPMIFSGLAQKYENLVMFKDTSGTDRVVLSGEPLEGLIAVRGAEGDYARWASPTEGAYHGFLLGSANCFVRELRAIIDEMADGRAESARRRSDRLSAVIDEVFRVVQVLPKGNAFANGNKAIDHFFAHGPLAVSAPPPRLHAGMQLPVEVIRATGEILSRYGLMPAKGYLD